MSCNYLPVPQEELKAAETTLHEMADFESVARSVARRKVQRIAVASGVFMVAQFGVIFQFVYTVRNHGGVA